MPFFKDISVKGNAISLTWTSDNYNQYTIDIQFYYLTTSEVDIKHEENC